MRKKSRLMYTQVNGKEAKVDPRLMGKKSRLMYTQVNEGEDGTTRKVVLPNLRVGFTVPRSTTNDR